MTETPHPHAVFWIDVAKISTNPYQPRKFFDQDKLESLSDSIKRYGVLQPIVVTRTEEFTEEGGMVARYELIAGERRLRASKLAGLEKIPAIIREGEQTDKEKLELAILENLQREDLNPVDKARSFSRLVEEFDLTHAQVAERLGKSREYVSNSMRILALPEHMLDALSQGRITEGHTRPLLMLKDRSDEQETLFMQLINSAGGMTVREAETFARGIAKEKQRINKDLDPEMKDMQQRLASHLGAKVQIDKSSQGGKVTIEFGNKADLRKLYDLIRTENKEVDISVDQQLDDLSASTPLESNQQEVKSESIQAEMDSLAQAVVQAPKTSEVPETPETPIAPVVPDAPVSETKAPLETEEEDQSRYSLNAMRQEIEDAKTKRFGTVPPEATSGTPTNNANERTFGFNDAVNEQTTGFNESNMSRVEANPNIHVRPAIIGSEFKPQTESEPLADSVALGGDFLPNKEKYLNPEGKTEPNSLADTAQKEDKDDVDPYNFGTFTV